MKIRFRTERTECIRYLLVGYVRLEHLIDLKPFISSFPFAFCSPFSFHSQGILESRQTCAPTTPDTLPALLWAIIAVFGIVYALLGYRCLRAVGFLSGLMVGANGIFILQDFQITWLGKPADSALAIVAGLLGAVLGSTYPVASVLISAFAGALLSGAAMAVCVATMPDNEFGVSPKPSLSLFPFLKSSLQID